MPTDFWNCCAVPANAPWIVDGTPTCTIVSSITREASLNDFPAGRLNEIVVATNSLWWFTASGVNPLTTVVTALSGTIVELLVATDALAEAELALLLTASELIDALVSAACACWLCVDALEAVPDDAVVPVVPADVRVPVVIVCVDADPDAVTGDVLIQICRSVSVFCQ